MEHDGSATGRQRWEPHPLLVLVCALVPFLVVVWYALHSIPNYDGGLNFQVARNMADGVGFVRDYGGQVTSPQEVETSGLFLVMAAGAIKAFGTSIFALQLTNLLFVALLFAAVVWAVRPWPWVMLIAPVWLLFTVPHTAELLLGGFGEGAVAALALAALVLIGTVAAGASRPLRRLTLAFLLTGLALTVKTVAVAAVPIVLLGLLLVLLARPALPRLRAVATVAAAALPVLAFELYRLGELGGLTGWRHYWNRQVKAAGWQSGASGDSAGILANGPSHADLPAVRPSGGIVTKAHEHLNVLGVATNTRPLLLVLLLVLPIVLTAVAFVMRREDWRSWLTRPGHVLLVLLAAYGAIYLAWWFFVTPDERAWLRRLVIGWIAIDVLYLMLAGMAVQWLRRNRAALAAAPGPRRVLLGAGAGVVVLLVGFSLAHVVRFNTRALGEPPSTLVTQERDASRYVAALARTGAHVYGLGWGSSPVVSVRSGVAFGNLETVDPCTPAMRQAIAKGSVYLVWDFNAMVTDQLVPREPRYRFTLVHTPSGYANVWRVALTPGVCA